MNEFWIIKPTAESINALAAIAHHIARKGQGPTLKEIADATGLKAISAVQRYVQSLADQGMVTFDREGVSHRMAARTLRVTVKGQRALLRFEHLPKSSLVRGERELVLNARAIAAAKRIRMPITVFNQYDESNHLVLVFQDRPERDYWAASVLEALRQSDA